MKKVLHIISSPRTDASVSRKLGNAIVGEIKKKYPEITLKERDLSKNLIPHLEETHVTSFFSPAESRTTEQEKINTYSEKLISELQEADIIVVDSPIYNFSITSSLKAYIDHVSRAGYTFSYSEKGPEGLLNNKKLYLAVSSGSIFSKGVYQANDFNVPYLKALFSFFGVNDTSVFRAEGLAMPGIMENALEKGIESIVID
ncbi:FMN-dependent NADH-azoreductase [Flaviramulus basaltis]|uniref:FMN dependent NADH:quinone oxidoreductase n=1 Tax=Flaviramulus basaltis TaxID=369401 RepID=A0A1K2I9W0_9FLAO|nr:NAD(P)H-dependent oxidoreductase [Flaviramulus basaltis]SFZ89175.1 FMN-dependent NADH-azoreductase [Flaviramulus basaltis]